MVSSFRLRGLVGSQPWPRLPFVTHDEPSCVSFAHAANLLRFHRPTVTKLALLRASVFTTAVGYADSRCAFGGAHRRYLGEPIQSLLQPDRRPHTD